MPKKSAGILLYRKKNYFFEFFLVHPGGFFWKNKVDGAWSIPKGEFDSEVPLDAALREFKEETGVGIAADIAIPLSPVKQKNGKIVYEWAIEKDIDEKSIKSNLVEMELHGRKISFPEVDKAGWFNREEAKLKINPAQFNLIDELMSIIEKLK
ncbi:MAG: NUDIX domain-containing protein [Bacteroidia bacterium]